MCRHNLWSDQDNGSNDEWNYKSITPKKNTCFGLIINQAYDDSNGPKEQAM